MSSGFVRFGDLCFKHRGLLLPVAVLLLFVPSPRIAEDAAEIGTLGFAVAVIGQLIRVTTIGLAYIIRGGKDHRVYAEDLVTTGLYGHTRNPMYLGNLFLLLGLALASNSWVFAIAGTAVAFITHWGIIAAEENFLRGKFGPAYDAYCARVPRLFPRLAGLSLTLASMEFQWRRVLIKEYRTPFDWLTAVAIVVLVNIWRDGAAAQNPWIVAVLLLFIVARLIAWRCSRIKAEPVIL